MLATPPASLVVAGGIVERRGRGLFTGEWRSRV